MMPLAMLLQHFGPPDLTATAAITWGGMLANLAPVIAGNLLGGSVLVGLSYHLIYRRKPGS